MPSHDTIFPADSVEFCPHPDATDIIACGTYKLVEPSGPDALMPSSTENDAPKTQERRGECIILQLVETTDARDEVGLCPIQSVQLPAVLDMKWCHRSESVEPLLAIATSEGNITLHQWETRERTLRDIDIVQLSTTDKLCLSLDWNNRRSSETGLGSLVVSLSTGSLSLLQPGNGGNLVIVDSWHAHDYEPWVAAWDYWNTNVIYSGGDDLKMKTWDVRQDTRQPIHVNSRFEAGVTSIQSHPNREHVLAVGSYDNTVRLFDARNLSRNVTQVDVGGGAWRVKWHPSPERDNDLLVACMHDGFKVIRFENTKNGCLSSGGILRRFDAHASLAYGVDWSYGSSDGAETQVASCSFYDHILHLWQG